MADESCSLCDRFVLYLTVWIRLLIDIHGCTHNNTWLFQIVNDENMVFELYGIIYTVWIIRGTLIWYPCYWYEQYDSYYMNYTAPWYKWTACNFYSHYSITTVKWIISSEVNIYPLLHFGLTPAPFNPYPKTVMIETPSSLTCLFINNIYLYINIIIK